MQRTKLFVRSVLTIQTFHCSSASLFSPPDLIDRIHSIMSHPAVAACSDLHQHLRKKKDMLQKKVDILMSELRVDQARYDPLSLQSILSIEEINVER